MKKNKYPQNTKSIAFVTQNINKIGGLELWSRRLINTFFKSNHKVTLVCSAKPKDDYFEKNISFKIIDDSAMLKSFKPSAFNKRAQQVVNQNKYDIIFSMDRTSFHTHMRTGNGVHQSYLNQRSLFEGYNKLLQFANPLNKVLLNLERKSFGAPNLKMIFANSLMVKKEIVKFYNVLPDKVQVVHNGADLKGYEDYFKQWPSKKNSLQKKGFIKSSCYHFLFIGNGYKRKGLNYLLEALSELKYHSFHLTIAGHESKIHRFKLYAHKLGLSDKITFLGPVSSTTELYQFCDCLIIPSIYDPFANVTQEALAMGLYVISSKHNGGYEVLSEKNGSVIDCLRSRDSFVQCLIKALERPKTLSSAKKIRSSIVELGLETQLEKYCNLCELK